MTGHPLFGARHQMRLKLCPQHKQSSDWIGKKRNARRSPEGPQKTSGVVDFEENPQNHFVSYVYEIYHTF